MRRTTATLLLVAVSACEQPDETGRQLQVDAAQYVNAPWTLLKMPFNTARFQHELSWLIHSARPLPDASWKPARPGKAWR